MHPVQAAMVAHHGSQCGFCTPGIVMSLFALYHEAERPVTRDAVNDALAGNLCRCTGYRPIVDAALLACAERSRRFILASELRKQPCGSQDIERFCATSVVGDAERFFAAPRAKTRLRRSMPTHPDATLVGGATDVGLWVTKSMAELDKVIWLGRVAGLRADRGWRGRAQASAPW